MASIEKVQRKDGIHYKITVSCGYDITGKKLREKTTFKPDPKLTPKQQEKALRDFVYDNAKRQADNRKRGIVKQGVCRCNSKCFSIWHFSAAQDVRN